MEHRNLLLNILIYNICSSDHTIVSALLSRKILKTRRFTTTKVRLAARAYHFVPIYSYLVRAGHLLLQLLLYFKLSKFSCFLTGLAVYIVVVCLVQLYTRKASWERSWSYLLWLSYKLLFLCSEQHQGCHSLLQGHFATKYRNAFINAYVNSRINAPFSTFSSQVLKLPKT